MRKIKLLSAAILLLVSCNIALAQKPAPEHLVRCATDEAIRQTFSEHPDFKAAYDQKNAQAAQLRGTATGRVSTLTGPVTIPVVVHVVLPNPTIITEEQIDYLLNRLNLDFSGRNPDSTNGTLFYGVRGHSLIRFTRARRTPAGQITNGLERRVGNIQIVTTTYQAIKHTSAGGLDPWDVTQYYNIWVGNSGNLLGIAPAIGVGAATETTTSTVGIDGVCINAVGFSNGCFSDPAYNLGRTAVHEIGHNFGLYHSFTGCADGADFAQPTPTTQTLPATLVGAAADDTPGLSTATTNCPTGAVASNCAGVPNPPGKMYQNYMDYTADACYSMFTNNQVGRMHYMLETYRPGYLTTQGAVPPAGFPAIDAAISAVVSPGGGEFNNSTCTITTYPTPNCPGAFTPRIQILNVGSTTLTSVSVRVDLTGATTFSQTYTNIPLNNLITDRTQTIALPNPITLNTGTTSITFTITQANGTTDSYTANNTATTTATIALSALPFAQDFSTSSATAFPPANMTVVNPTGTNTWVYNANGNGNPGSAFINNYTSNTPGQIDDIRTIPFTPPAGTTASDSVIISFDVAYKNYPAANSDDILSVLVSNDCGSTFTTIYSKAGAVLATAGASTASYTTPAATDWRRERVGISGALLTGGPIVVTFRNTNFYGNNIFIDNINIVRKFDRDIGISAITAPPANICSNSTNVQAVVSNTGAQTITSFSAGYQVNGSTPVTQAFTQTIAPGASATINFTTPVTGLPANANTIKVFTFNPISAQGTGDLQRANDTLTKSFNVAPLFALPLVQGFETTPFPPANWTLVNPNNNVTWVRNNHGNNSSWSAFIDNYNFNLPGQLDALQTPALRLAGADSMIVSFDVAHKNYPGANDVLQVLVSTDCGQTFTSYYSKAGATLATAGSSTTDYTNPGANDWRRERVSVPTAAITSGSVIVKFQNTNAYGNNIFLDNINITPVYRRDIQLVSINQPGNIVCTTSTTPSVTVRNAGIETITGYKVGYLLDNSTTPVVSTFTSVSLAANATATVSLTAITLAAGQHVIKIFTFDPVTATGTGDPNPTNDTLQKTVAVIGTQAAPLVEGFEARTFPPTGWGVVNPDGAITWQRTDTARRSNTDTASAYINNRNYTARGSRDELYTPRITYSGVDSLFMSFDVAATTYNYPGSTDIPLDTLEVLITTDCGTTFTSIYKKWGNELQTVNDPNGPQTAGFIPTSRSQWRTERIALPAFVSLSSIQVVFRNTNNNENNIFIDNVNVNTKTLPVQLKDQGYLIYPSPFTSTFFIQHYLPPTELRGIAVYNSVGQRVWAREYGTTGTTSLTQVDLSRFANDVYTVVLRYTNRTISQKIIKAN